MKLHNSDIDALIDTVVTLEMFATQTDDPAARRKYEAMAQRVRKVYIFLLHSLNRGQTDFSKLFSEGIDDNEPVITAVKAMCPAAANDN
jgi:hypothetical protein